MKFPQAFTKIAVICLLFCLPACAGGNHYGQAGVAISPVSANLQVGQSQQFSATVSGSKTQAVNWVVNSIPGGSPAVGTITASGLYTAPAAPPSGAVTVTAQSVNPNAPSASATVIITSGTTMSVSISPTSASLQTGQTQQFSATVSGAVNTATTTGGTTTTSLNWLVNGILGGNSTVGTISLAGLYTAPAAAPSGPVTVTAQSVSQPSTSASASVSITQPPQVTVSISPTNASLQTGQTQPFSATVSGATNTSVNWLVNGVPGGNSTSGTITSAGLYTAPAAAPSGAVTVTAQSVYQPSTSASASVSITQPPQVTVSISPTNASLQIGQTQQFSATVSGTSNTGINWLVNGVPGGSSTAGTISSAGLYTAPATVPSSSVTVTAQSVYQSSTTASASVSIAPPPPVTVSISPTSASLQTSQTQQFSATVSGATNTSVSWLVNGVLGGNSSLGTISSTGLYTAPGNATQVTVTGQSVSQPSNSATAAVTVTLPVSHSVSLSWQSSASSPAGYNLYRAAQATGPFAKLNSSLETATVYMDNTVVSGRTYYYVTTAVDSSGLESSYSNVAQAVVP